MTKTPRLISQVTALAVTAFVVVIATASTAAGALATRTGGPDLTPLQAMVAPLATTSHDVLMKTANSTVQSSVDPVTHVAAVSAKAAGIEIDEVVDNGKVWIKADFGTDLNDQIGITANQWMLLDNTKISSNNDMLLQPDASDPIDMPGIMNGVTSIKVVDPRHVTGTIDLTKVTGHNLPDKQEMQKAGSGVKHMPFTATADASGRLANFHVEAQKIDPTLSLDVTWNDYGSSAAVTTPATAVPAPPTLYEVFNN